MPLPALSPTEISQRCLKLFNPNFKSPRSSKSVKEPKPTSLSWSKLPPPAAEVDERPSYRIRRFRLWKDVTPELRKVVLDPKKRAHLRRYHSYAIPATPSYSKRISLPVALPQPTQEGLPTLNPNDDEWTWTTPLRPRPGARPRLEVSVSVIEVNLEAEEEGKGLERQLEGLDMKDALVDEGGLPTPPLTAINTPFQLSFHGGLDGIDEFTKLKPIDEVSLAKYLLKSEDPLSNVMREGDCVINLEAINDSPEDAHHTSSNPNTDINVNELTNLDSQPKPSTSSSDIPRGYPTPTPPSKFPSPSSQAQQAYWLPPLPEPKYLPWLNKSIHKKTRKINYQKLLENKWILDQEHERRFRIGIEMLMRDVMVWQDDNTIPYDQWKKGICKWKNTVDLQDIQDTTELFKQIRKKSTNIYQYLNPDQITQVPFRDRVHELVKNEDARKRRKREKKEARKRAAELEQDEKAKKGEVVVEGKDQGQGQGQGQGQVDSAPLCNTTSDDLGVRPKVVRTRTNEPHLLSSSSTASRKTNGHSRGTNTSTSHVNPHRQSEPNLHPNSSKQTNQRGNTFPLSELAENPNLTHDLNFIFDGKIISDDPHIAKLIHDLKSIREQKEKLESMIAENTKEIERRKNEKVLTENKNKMKGVEMQGNGKRQSDEKENEEERYLNNPIDSQGNILTLIPSTEKPGRSNEEKIQMEDDQNQSAIDELTFQSETAENFNLTISNNTDDGEDTQEDTKTNLTTKSDDRFQGDKLNPDMISTENMFRFGSLNLDDDTALPMLISSSLSSPSDLRFPRYWKDQSNTRIPSSAFSRNDLHSNDSYDQSLFSSIGETTVRAIDDQDQDRDQDTLLSMKEEQGDTKYGYSTSEGNSFDKFTLTGLDSPSP